MSKFCENCGAEMNDDETICKYCGPQQAESTNAVESDSTTEETTSNTSSNSSNSNSTNIKNIGIIAGIAVAIIAFLAIIVSMLSGGYKKPIDNYFKGMEKANAKIYLKAFPEFLDMDDTVDKDYMEKIHDKLEDEYGKKLKISYKITKKEKIKKSKLDDVKEYIKKKYKEDVKVSAGFELKVKETIKGKDDEDTNTQKMYVYKINGKWYYLAVSPDTAENYITK